MFVYGHVGMQGSCNKGWSSCLHHHLCQFVNPEPCSVLGKHPALTHLPNVTCRLFFAIGKKFDEDNLVNIAGAQRLCSKCLAV